MSDILQIPYDRLQQYAVVYLIDGKQVKVEEFLGNGCWTIPGHPAFKWENGKWVYIPPPPSNHVHKFKRYTGLQKTVDYCDCGFEQPVDWKELNNESDSKNEVKTSR